MVPGSLRIRVIRILRFIIVRRIGRFARRRILRVVGVFGAHVRSANIAFAVFVSIDMFARSGNYDRLRIADDLRALSVGEHLSAAGALIIGYVAGIDAIRVFRRYFGYAVAVVIRAEYTGILNCR